MRKDKRTKAQIDKEILVLKGKVFDANANLDVLQAEANRVVDIKQRILKAIAELKAEQAAIK